MKRLLASSLTWECGKVLPASQGMEAETDRAPAKQLLLYDGWRAQS